MNSEDSKKVKWFKKEFESYLSQSPIRKQIETKIELLKSKFDLHSSQWGSVHYSGQDNDCKLADYVAKKEELEKELEVLNYQSERVHRILDNMKPWERKDLEKIFLGRKKYSDLAKELGFSETKVKGMFDLAILQAVKKYEDSI